MRFIVFVLNVLEIIGNIGAFLFIPIIFKFIFQRKEWHLYYRSIFSSVIVACTIHTLSSLVIYTIIFHVNRIPVLGENFELTHVYSLARYFLKGSCGTVRICIWILVIERTFATVKKKNYELHHNYFVAVILFIIPFAYGYNIDNIGHFWPFFRNNYVKFCIAIDCLTLLVLIILWLLNRKLHQLHHEKVLTLSEKFQISENIRLSKLSLPVTILFILDNYTFNIIFSIGIFTPEEDEFLTLLNYGSLAYCYAGFFIFVLYQYKEKFSLQFSIGRNKVVNSSNNDVSSKNNDNSQRHDKTQVIKMKNANNKLVPMDYDQKSYFNVYANTW
uniref:G_PROTEIN_RECEP_F1_2 domain-containing protein n=1 Tax=Strongyloides papillosus TaxID=174720 RepID=A0A0N5BJD7_STREA